MINNVNKGAKKMMQTKHAASVFQESYVIVFHGPDLSDSLTESSNNIP
jgi:hypothetical protein